MTIKRNGDRVILKGGKVSCSCCGGPPGECCMYPAQALGDDQYTYDDLPDVIEVLIDNVFTPFSRSGIYFYSDSAIGLIPAGDYRVRLLDTGVPWVPGTEDFQYRWRLEVWDGISWGTIDDIDDWQCLIQGLPEDFERTHDQFADTYTVYVNGLGGIFNETFTVVRRSLCVWSSDVDEGEPSGVILTPPQSFSEKWALEVGGDLQAKDDPQNSPIGLYGDQGTEVS